MFDLEIKIVLGCFVAVFFAWLLLKFIIRQVFYTATKAIEDAKTDVKKTGKEGTLPPSPSRIDTISKSKREY
jgi:hypothetical protein